MSLDVPNARLASVSASNSASRGVSVGRVTGPEMPARRSRWSRVQLNTRVRVEVEALLHRFVNDNDTTVQSSVDLALVEFLAARGYPLPAGQDAVGQHLERAR